MRRETLRIREMFLLRRVEKKGGTLRRTLTKRGRGKRRTLARRNR